MTKGTRYIIFNPIVAVFLFIAGSFMLGLSFKNMDLAFNMVNSDCIDVSILGIVQSPKEIYGSGAALFIFAWAMMLIGFITYILGMAQEK